MTLFAPGLVEIKGKRCLIIADSVSHELPSTSHTVLLAQAEGLNIFCLAEELVKKKAAHRGVPVYGYWQTLYASKQWRPKGGITAYQHNNSGQYVAVDEDEKTAITGEVVNGCAVAAAGEQLNLEKIRWLEVSTQDIRLPSRAAMTMAEQLAKQEKNNRTLLLAAACAVIALIFGLISGAWFADKEMRRFNEHSAALNMEIEAMRDTAARLSKIKLGAVPNQQEMLSLLEALSWIDGIEMPQSKINAIQLSVPYQSYTDIIYILAQHNIPYTEQWLAEGHVQFNLR